MELTSSEVFKGTETHVCAKWPNAMDAGPWVQVAGEPSLVLLELNMLGLRPIRAAALNFLGNKHGYKITIFK